MKLPSNSMRSSTRHKKAYTMVEMMVVLAIIGIVTAVGIPALKGLTASGQMNQNLLQLSGLLEQARQYAVAQNTYVWVAFSPSTDANGKNALAVAMLTSQDGTDPASPNSWTAFSYTAAQNNNQIALASKIITLHQLSLQPAGTFGNTQIATLPASPPVNSTANSYANYGAGFFSLQIPGTSSPQIFNEAIQFTPTGEVRNGSNPVNIVELDCQAQKGTVTDPNGIAVIRVNGLTGESVIYRR